MCAASSSVCLRGLEPQADRRQAGLLLTRQSHTSEPHVRAPPWTGALRGAQRVLQWELLEARPPRASSLPLPRQHHVTIALEGQGLLVLGGSCGERVLGEALLLRPDDAPQAQAQPRTPTRTDSPPPPQQQQQQQQQQQWLRARLPRT